MQRIRLSEAKEILAKSGYIVESEVVVSSFKDRVMECLKQLCVPLLKNPYDPEDVFEKAYNIYKRKYSDGYDAFDTAKEMVARYRFMVKWHEI